MKLSELLRQVTYRLVRGTDDIRIQAVKYDSRLVEKGDVFVCIRGYETDGHRFLLDALEKGAAAVVVQEYCAACRPERPDKVWMLCREYDERISCQECWRFAENITVAAVPDTRYALSRMASAYYGYPAKRMKIIGITGTKGKTTTAYMIREGLLRAGHKTGLIGTVQIDTGMRTLTCSNTTPESVEIQKYLREMADSGCDSVVMEVSSQALKLHRTAGICFTIGVFTNLGMDHIGPGEHADMEEYLQCKRKLFFQCETAVGNADDAYLTQIWEGTSCRKITFGIVRKDMLPDYRASKAVYVDMGYALGTRCRIEGRMNGELKLAMPGAFNVSNALAAVSVLQYFHIPEHIIWDALERVQVPGRMESLPAIRNCKILVDYAHNAMSLKQSLETLRGYGPRRLVVIFGCGGNRSRERRFMMGETAGRYADYTIITTDNPRYEAPWAIIEDIEAGMKKTDGQYKIIEDRQEAVSYAIRNRKDGDVILIAGKGHENYQEIQGIRYPMDDRELVRKCTQTLL